MIKSYIVTYERSIRQEIKVKVGAHDKTEAKITAFALLDTDPKKITETRDIKCIDIQEE